MLFIAGGDDEGYPERTAPVIKEEQDKGVNVICLMLDAPMDVINALSGKLGRLPGVSAKAVTPKNTK